jgi:hypothetical protein
MANTALYTNSGSDARKKLIRAAQSGALGQIPVTSSALEAQTKWRNVWRSQNRQAHKHGFRNAQQMQMQNVMARSQGRPTVGTPYAPQPGNEFAPGLDPKLYLASMAQEQAQVPWHPALYYGR